MIVENSSFDILCLLETPGVGSVKVASILELMQDRNISLHTLLGNPNELRKVLNPKQVATLLENSRRVHELWERLQKEGVKLIPITGCAYPRRLIHLLGKKSPPLLAVLGNCDLLSKASVGFCGSRKASEKGLATAWDCADQLAREGINVVSGYAAGVDISALKAALQCGGTTTVVLSEGILNFRIKQPLQELWDWSRVAVISEFLPGVPWSVRNAMQRNKTICALSQAMILIEAGTTGGSIDAGWSSLKMGIPLFAPVYEGMPRTALGNQELLKNGAKSLLRSRTTTRANMTEVVATVFNGSTNYTSDRCQLSDEGDAVQPLLFEKSRRIPSKNT